MVREFNKGQIILFEGDEITHLYKLSFGAVKIFTIDSSGEEHILTIRSAPDIFPVLVVIGEKVSPFFYGALTYCRAELLSLDDYDPQEILAQTVRLFYEALHRIAALESRSAAERVILAKKFAESHHINPTQQVIAELSNTTRESVSLALHHHSRGIKSKRYSSRV